MQRKLHENGPLAQHPLLITAVFRTINYTCLPHHYMCFNCCMCHCHCLLPSTFLPTILMQLHFFNWLGDLNCNIFFLHSCLFFYKMHSPNFDQYIEFFLMWPLPKMGVTVRDDVLTSNILFKNILIMRVSQTWLKVSYVSWSCYLL